MTNSKLPIEPEAFCDIVQEGHLDNQTLLDEIQNHATHEVRCELCAYIADEGLGSTMAEFLISSHAKTVDSSLIDYAISQINQWAFDNNGFDGYLTIALNPNSSRETLDQAFEFLEDYGVYSAFLQSGEDYFSMTIARLARHPLSDESDIRRWIAHNHYMSSEVGWEGHDEDEDSCELCERLLRDSHS